MSNPTSAQASICATIASVLKQKKDTANFNIPPSRLNIPFSPYRKYTNMQLDMRRKAEILKYNGVTQNSKTNSQTKTQLYSYLANNKINSNVSQYALTYALKDLNCATNKNLPTLTTACDVPGPPMYLYNDPSIPLYNYSGIVNNRSSGIINSPPPAAWSIYTTNEILYLNTTAAVFTNTYIQSEETELGSMLISTSMKQNVSNFTISTPIAIWCRGLNGAGSYDAQGNYILPIYNPITKTYDHPRPTDVSMIDINITGVSVKVYANDLLVTSSNTCTQTFATVTVNPNKTSPNIFYAVDYVGMLQINNLVLKTQPGYNYTIKLKINYSYNISKASQITAFEAGVFCNLSPGNIKAFGNPATMDDKKNVISVSSPNVPYSNGSFVQYNDLF